jgi:large subunit ribosomal protein L24
MNRQTKNSQINTHVKTHVKRGDLVEVIAGENRGSRGVVLRVIRKQPPAGLRVLVEGVNFIKKAQRPSQERPSGGFNEREAPIHISNVKLVERKK